MKDTKTEQGSTATSKFVSGVYRYNTNNIAGYRNVTIGQCNPHTNCCVHEMER